jgi:hypothetical protein
VEEVAGSTHVALHFVDASATAEVTNIGKALKKQDPFA